LPTKSIQATRVGWPHGDDRIGRPHLEAVTGPARVAVLSSHPIQYFAPLFRRLVARPELDLTVLYCSRLGTAAHAGPMRTFGRPVVWDINVLDGYRHKFLPSLTGGDPGRRWSLVNPAIVAELAYDRYDLLVSFGWAYPTNWLAFTTARASRTPFLLYGDTDVRREGGFVEVRVSADAFLRRIQSKINVVNPTANQFREIFKRQCEYFNIPFDQQGLIYLLREHYVKQQRELRACHPRDILRILLGIAKYLNAKPCLQPDLIDRACQSYFVDLG
jgi:hypothetical protein